MAPPLDNSGEDRNRATLVAVDRLQRALGTGDRANAVENLRVLIALDAPMGPQWRQLAMIGADFGELDLARAASVKYVDGAGASRAARYNNFALLGHIGDFEDAYRQLAALGPDYPDRFTHANNRGAVLLNLGDSGEARDWLESAVRLQPTSGDAWYRLSMTVDFAAEPELAEDLRAQQAAMERSAPSNRTYCRYALGKLHADLGEYAEAFRLFAAAGRDMGRLNPYDRYRDRSSAEEAVQGYDTEAIARFAREQDQPTERTIFVAGLPRSGTTLVEQILASHSEVADGGELELLGLLQREVKGSSLSALKRHVEGGSMPALARLWHHWLDQRFKRPGRIVDKTNQSSRMMGLAASVLPRAPIVWLRRNPADCAISCFRTCFPHSMPWSNDLDDIAFHFRLEDALFDHWRNVLGPRMLVVPFEELVTNPADWTRRILSHCGLAEEPSVFVPHETKRAVPTASAMQVRRAINRQGVGAAAPYRAWLGEFENAYSS